MMLILNAVLAVTIVTAILSLLGWGIVTERARMASITRHASRRTRVHAGVQAAQPGYRPYGRAPELSA
ncbi:MAG TPA: hypothetical protein VIM18_01670 [Solirubrobacteraceae bacterium]